MKGVAAILEDAGNSFLDHFRAGRIQPYAI